MTGTLKIDGNDYDYTVYYPDTLMFWKEFNKVYLWATVKFKKTHGVDYDPANKDHVLPLNNDFYFMVAYTVLDKKGFGPFRKPFRSKGHLRKCIRQDEFQNILDITGRDILKLQWYEDREQGNERKCHSEDTLMS